MYKPPLKWIDTLRHDVDADRGFVKDTRVVCEALRQMGSPWSWTQIKIQGLGWIDARDLTGWRHSSAEALK